MKRDEIVRIGVSACLLGEKVRFNGEAKRQNTFLEQLREQYEVETCCPEVGIGLGVPRDTIRLIDFDGESRARGGPEHSNDYTDDLRTYARNMLGANPDWCGYIGVKGSPSCGYARVKRYNQAGNSLVSDGVGLFIDELRRLDPLLPVEEDGRLNDVGLRHSFMLRVLTYARWKELLATGPSAKALIDFYARHKYLVMAHSIKHYKQLGHLLSDAGKQDIDALGRELIGLMMEAFSKPANRKGHANALYHISGYLKKKLESREREEIRALIDQYREGEVPLVVPVKLLDSYFARHPDPYISEQLFLLPFPDKLGLRNSL
jgi:uncharacterized protein YbgA (DUF1722 family)/uncharacterized protein YbbK (DUF523 family)